MGEDFVVEKQPAMEGRLMSWHSVPSLKNNEVEQYAKMKSKRAATKRFTLTVAEKSVQEMNLRHIWQKKLKNAKDSLREAGYPKQCVPPRISQQLTR